SVFRCTPFYPKNSKIKLLMSYVMVEQGENVIVYLNKNQFFLPIAYRPLNPELMNLKCDKK
ncbi:MAG: hypothetical protein PHQ11_17275, partial [Paludibacter sp.]|nr:hypothetical protein [Paludibacter sp.]